MKKPIIIGIAGGSASGKTSVARKLVKNFDDDKTVAIIRQDDYYRDQSHMPFQERLKTNYDHPDAFDNELLIRQIDELASGKSVEKPTYDYVNHTRSTITEVVHPSDVLILEGLFVLEDEEIRKRLDMKIFIDTDADIRFIRRLKRDVRDRGRTIESVCDQYMNTVRVMHEAFVEPSKRKADVIIPEGSHNEVAMDLLLTKISSIITSKKSSD
ncbi:MAG: uridine kinase [Erysipelotrichaceae bacterium]|jgi:uridine kinase|nr:uridine kinase [Erysipelotrichaceae bacterium]MBQ1304288.1 uridine kinase [Erysipelotrichaceae bacterium]MBQ2685773.1 uridine kinase [Erysipelotrichaceae bacterium]